MSWAFGVGGYGWRELSWPESLKGIFLSKGNITLKFGFGRRGGNICDDQDSTPQTLSEDTILPVLNDWPISRTMREYKRKSSNGAWESGLFPKAISSNFPPIFPLTAHEDKSIFQVWGNCSSPWLSKLINLTFNVLRTKMRRWGCQKMVMWSLQRA